DIADIVTRLGRIAGLDEICATTNGHELPELASTLAAAGLRSINVSLDTLNAERFAQLSGGRVDVARVLAGVDAPFAAGMQVKLNAVVLKGINDGDAAELIRYAWGKSVVPRFIECMPFREGEPVPTADLVARLAAEGIPLSDSTLDADAPRGPARYYRG